MYLLLPETSRKNNEESIESQLDRCKTSSFNDGDANPKEYSVSESAWKSNNLAPMLDKVNRENIRIIYAREPDRLSQKSFFLY